MTQNQIEKYFKIRLKQRALVGDLSSSEITDLIKSSIEMGIDDFWGRRAWSFTFIEDTIDTSTAADSYNLNPKCNGVNIVTETESTDGEKLAYMAKEDFDSITVSPTSHVSGYPKIYTVWQIDKVWKIAFYPAPTVSSVTVIMKEKPPETVNEIPEYAMAALIATIEKYIYPTGSIDRVEAGKSAYLEILELERRDRPDVDKWTRIKTGYDVAVPSKRVWE